MLSNNNATKTISTAPQNIEQNTECYKYQLIRVVIIQGVTW